MDPDYATTADAKAERRLTVTFIVTCLLMMSGGLAMNAAIGPRATAQVVALGDMSAATLVEIRDQRGAVALSGEFRSRVDSLGNTEKDAELTDQQGRTVIGEVELEIPAPTREHRRVELEVDIIHLRPRERYTVVIDDRTVGVFVTDDRGSVDLELQEGEMAEQRLPRP